MVRNVYTEMWLKYKAFINIKTDATDTKGEKKLKMCHCQISVANIILLDTLLPIVLFTTEFLFK
jgi:hypothetical protein